MLDKSRSNAGDICVPFTSRSLPRNRWRERSAISADEARNKDVNDEPTTSVASTTLAIPRMCVRHDCRDAKKSTKRFCLLYIFRESRFLKRTSKSTICT